MCGIAGIIHRKGGKSASVGSEMTSMLQSLKHRGPDSTGFAVYGGGGKDYIMRIKAAEAEDVQKRGSEAEAELKATFKEITARLKKHGAKIKDEKHATPYSGRYVLTSVKNPERVAQAIEEIPGVEILSLGHALELVKDLGDSKQVSDAYALGKFKGTHAIGHTRMATESDVDIRSAHPYWAFPYNDVSLVHNGQVTNYWNMRREMERLGHRFMSNCDSELLAVYVAHHLNEGVPLEDVLRRSIEEIDGVFTYLVATKDMLGMAKDTMAAKPLVLYESKDLIAMASEEVAIRAILPQEIDTYDPYDEEVRVWQA